MMFQIMKKAVANDLIRKNPVEFADRTKVEKQQPSTKDSFTAEEVEREYQKRKNRSCSDAAGFFSIYFLLDLRISVQNSWGEREQPFHEGSLQNRGRCRSGNGFCLHHRYHCVSCPAQKGKSSGLQPCAAAGAALLRGDDHRKLLCIVPLADQTKNRKQA
jgi:cellulase/cellobiase CelA1